MRDSYGTLITHSSAFFARIQGVDWQGIERAMLETTHLATPATSNGRVVRTFVPSDIVGMGSLSLQMDWDPDNPPPLYGDEEEITLTAPVPRGKAKGATMTGMAAFSGAGMAMPGPGQKMTSTAELTWCGPVTFTASS